MISPEASQWRQLTKPSYNRNGNGVCVYIVYVCVYTSCACVRLYDDNNTSAYIHTHSVILSGCNTLL